MKKAKLKDKKEIVEDADLNKNIRNGIIVLLSIIVVFLGFYLLTDYLVSNRKTDINSNSNNDKVDSTNIIFNKLLSQKEEEYYVFAILNDDKNKSIYNVYATDLKTVYYIDMRNSFNKNHIGEETKITESAKDIKISDTTLFHIKDGKIETYKSGSKEIVEYLKSQIKVKDNK